MDTAIETNNENQSEQVDQQIEKRPVGRPKKYFNDDGRKEAIRKQQLATKRRYAQKKAQIYTQKPAASLLFLFIQNDVNFNPKTDINTNFVGAEEFSTLLNVKADKSELIDSYTKTEDDALLLQISPLVKQSSLYSDIEVSSSSLRNTP
ncbi:MAG: hypothetical protein EZS28_048936 [Streblomastix strix]|uniref:Uncharacterized protein n=1 Tax=Streblomastix strix TaxID=222440 RepID=A0A5J4TBC1_9EUKA|nr:MAG: hypothetical protein EZS28_048936 [Streblomastix strix]